MALSISAGSSISQSSTALRGGSADLGAQPRAEILVNLGDEGSGDQWRQAGGAPRFIYFANAFPDDPEARARRAAFREAFEKLGWIDGRNIRIDEHWGTLPPGRLRAVAAELVRSAPNVILTSGSGMSEALQLESRTVPVVLIAVTDPLSSGLVASMAHPGGVLTGFAKYESAIGGKWLEMLKDVAPATSRVLVILQSGNIGRQSLLRTIEMSPAAIAARQATTEIPIVMAPTGDPVGTGLISSLARPAATSPDCPVWARSSEQKCSNSSARCCRQRGAWP